MTFFSVLSTTASVVLAQLVLSSSVDPEEALFSFTRCAEIYAEPLQGSYRAGSIERWATWSLENWFNDNTECYVQCILERLRLFDLGTGKLKPEQIDLQFDKYGTIAKVWSNDRDILKSALSGISSTTYQSCKDLFKAYIDAIQRKRELLAILQKLYHDTENVNLVYDDLAQQGTPVRAVNQSYFEYCEKKYYSEDTAALCKIRKYQIDDANSGNFQKLIECVFKGLRYIDAENNFNSSEIIRDFKLVNQPHFNNNIKECAAKQDTVEAYKCFVQGDSSFVTAFKEAFDYREVRSRDYCYRLNNPVYDQTQIKQEVGAIDKNIPCV